MPMRERWNVKVPPGGWGRPWPQCLELARALPSEQWTLVGGLMVQLHASRAGMDVARPTDDVDIVLHIETGAATASGVQEALGRLGYQLQISIDKDAPAHRFVRGKDTIDVMIADHAAPRIVPRIAGRPAFQIPAGTQALQRTVDCLIDLGSDTVTISVPNTLGALVLKAAAYTADARDARRHLDDAVVLLATVEDPVATASQLKGHDRSRIRRLQQALQPGHQSWMLLGPGLRQPALDALRILAADPPSPAPRNRLLRP